MNATRCTLVMVSILVISYGTYCLFKCGNFNAGQLAIVALYGLEATAGSFLFYRAWGRHHVISPPGEPESDPYLWVGVLGICLFAHALSSIINEFRHV